MSVQDKLERILREMHIMISRGQVAGEDENCVIINKKDMQKTLTALSQTVSEMMEIYEMTAESRDRAEREAEKQRTQIVRNANLQAEDIYAASVIYTDDALGRIQDIIDEAEKSTKEVLTRLNREMEEEKRIVRSNQVELKVQLEDLKDTAKYIKIIEERNREAAKEKAKKQEDAPVRRYERKTEKEPVHVTVVPEIKINEEYFEKAGLTPEGLPVDMESSQEKTYEKPEIKINEEYFKKAGIPLEEELSDSKETSAENNEEIAEEFIDPELEEKLKEDLDIEYFEWRDKNPQADHKKEKRRGILSFGRWEKS